MLLIFYEFADILFLIIVDELGHPFAVFVSSDLALLVPKMRTK